MDERTTDRDELPSQRESLSWHTVQAVVGSEEKHTASSLHQKNNTSVGRF